MNEQNLLYVVAYIAIFIGLLGSLLPVVPGPFLIWGGVLLWVWTNGFVEMGWPTLIILGILALVAEGLDFILTTGMSRRAGVSWRAIGAALLGALVGGVILTGVFPLIGTLIGAILGGVAAMWAVEYYIRKDSRTATAAVRAYLSGVGLAALAQFGIAVLMVLIFAWQAFV
jgi:uncharacterized protein YqgC (DUF456 family)